MFNLARKLQIGLAVLMLANTAQGQSLWQPPPLTPGREQQPQVTHAESSAIRITSIKVAGYPVALERTPLQDAHVYLGGVVGHQGDAGDGLIWLCYLQPDRQPPTWTLWLEQRGDLYNPPLISGFQWQTLPARSAPDARCKTLPRTGKVSLPVPIRLGQSRAAIVNLLGSPTAKYPQALVYSASRQKKMISTSGAHIFTEIETIAVNFDHGKVVAINVYKSTTD
jgi:hypothetical protein